MIMPIITCNYYGSIYSILNRKHESIDVGDGTTVEALLEMLVQKYGQRLKPHLYSEGFMEGRYYKTASVYVNKKRIQWVQDFPDGLRTKLRQGDVLSLGLIMGGGSAAIQAL